MSEAELSESRLGYVFFILEASVALDKGLFVEVCDFLLIAQK
jgi:hypothetical protein